MHTLKQNKEMMDIPMSMGRMLPSFSLSAKDLPEIKSWKVGKKYKLEMEVEMVSLNKDEYGKMSSMDARFKIHKIGEKETMSDEEKEARMGHY